MSHVAWTFLALVPVLFFSSNDPEVNRWRPGGDSDADRPSPAACRSSGSTLFSETSPVGAAEPGDHVPVAFIDFSVSGGPEPGPGWEVSVRKPGFDVVEDPTAPASPPNVAQATYPPGFGDGRSPVSVEKEISGQGHSRLYVCLWFRLSENWQGHRSGVNKLGYVWTNGNPMVYMSAMGHGYEPLEAHLRLQGLPSALSSARNLRPNVGGVEVERGRWHLWELVLVANDWASADGEAHWWIDGVKIGDYRDIRFMDPTEERAWERVSWRPVWGGRGDAVLETQYMWLDHMYVSGAP